MIRRLWFVVLLVFVASLAAAAKLELVKGSTSVELAVFVQDSSSTTGAGLTGLAWNTSGLGCHYWRESAAADTDITLATATLGTWATGGFIVIDGTNMPGMYSLHVPDAALAAGADNVVVFCDGATNMAPLILEIQLTDLDWNDATRGGLAALPNAAADAAGGLVISDAGGLDIDGLNTNINDIETDTSAGGAGPWATATGFSTSAALSTAQTDLDTITGTDGVTLATAQALYDIPTNAELDLRTLPSASYFDPAVDAVATVTTLAGHTAQTADHTANIAAILVDTGTTLDGALATVDANVDAVLVDTSTTLDGAIATVDANVDAILVDTAAYDTDAERFSAAILARFATVDTLETSAVSGSVAEIAQGAAGDPWSTAVPGAYGAGTAGFVLGTNLDAILTDRTLAAASYFDPAADTVATVTTLTGHTAQTTDHSANIAAILVDTGTTLDAALGTVDANVDAILTDTGTTLDTHLTDIKGATFSGATDSLEAIRDRGDIAWVTGGASPNPTGTCDSGSTTTCVDTERTEADNDYFTDSWIRFTSGTLDGQTKLITNFVAATDTLSFDATTAAVGTHSYEIIPAAAITGASAPSAVDIRTEIDSNSTQLAAIVLDTGTTLDAALAVVDGNVDAVLVDTVAGGAGPWTTATCASAGDCASPAEVATELATYDGPTDAEMDARTLLAASYFDPAADTVANVTTVATTTTNTDMLTAAAVNAEVDTALADYNGPTSAEFDARTILAADYFDPAADTVANVTTVATTTTNTDMRGTDSAALASVATEARLAELDAANLPADVDAILADTGTTLDAALAVVDANVDSILADTAAVEPMLPTRLLAEGTAQAGAAGSITLAAGASSTSDFYYGSKILVTSGTGALQDARTIVAYDGTTKIATVYPNWTVAPDVTSVYEITASGGQ